MLNKMVNGKAVRMMQLFKIFLVWIFCTVSYAQSIPNSIESCSKDAVYGLPIGKIGVTICRSAYITSVDASAKIPMWTIHTITPEEAVGCYSRSNKFEADLSMPIRSRTTPNDYMNSGYDKGHLVPDGDMNFDLTAGYESFLMTNMVPQLPGLNRGLWKKLETVVRGYSEQHNRNVTVYAGPIYKNSKDTIGNGVVVPTDFYKIVIDNTTSQVWAFKFPHKSKLGKNLDSVISNIADIERLTDLKFPLPKKPKFEESSKNLDMSFKQLKNQKTLECKVSFK
jgi:endonuclease G